jgi:uncharacterized protein YndB with AHSA1/START domain
MDHTSLDMAPYTPSSVVDVGANDTEEITFQGPSSKAFGVTRIHLSAESPRKLKMTLEASSDGDRTQWNGVLARAVQRYFDGYALRVPILLAQSEEMTITLEDTSGSSQRVGVQLEGIHDEPLERLQERMDLDPVHRELSWFYGTTTLSSGASLSDLGVNYEKRRGRAFDRFTVAADADVPHQLEARLVTGNSAVRRPATFDQIHRAFEHGKRAPTPYETEPFGVFSVEGTNNDSSDHEVSFLAASLPPSFYE